MTSPTERIETAKERSLRVPLDYFRHADALGRVKWLLSGAAALAALAYVGWLLVDPQAGPRHVAPGRLAVVHATWESDCRACHEPLRPLRSDAVDWAAVWERRSAPEHSADAAAAGDATCIRCHPGPAHQKTVVAGETESCAACHRDHQGANADLARVADRSCTRCHADVAAHRTGPSQLSPPLENVTGFGPATASGGPHPPFRSLAHDPGNIKFNHWLHLQPGITPRGAKRQLRVSDLDEDRRERFARYAAADGVLQLDCAACHETDARSSAERGVADDWRPLAYERHCRACHPLRATLSADDDRVAEIPHGQTGAQLTATLDGWLWADTRNRLPAPPATDDESADAPLIPGRTLGRNLAQKLAGDVLRRRETLAGAVAAACQQCHYRLPTDEASASGGLGDVVPAQLSSNWFAHARFAHRAHGHVECRQCHAAAYAFEERDQPRLLVGAAASGPVGGLPARDDDQVMIAGIETCTACHAPARRGAGVARNDCAECHVYHHTEVEARPRAGESAKVAARAAPSAPAVRLASFSAAPPAYVGLAGCAATNCHGDRRPSADASRSAAAVWLASDPHREASAVLDTFRGREMTRLLTTPPPPAADWTEAAHRRIVRERCLACHATPTPDERGAAPATASFGVECESCHGPAERWLVAHRQTGFVRDAALGFRDTRDLNARAAVCLPCHLGPGPGAAGQTVSHDLIAAGHPRLQFDFSTYLESLPAHWDRQRDEAANAPFSFRAWLAGAQAQARQIAALKSHFQGRPGPAGPEFSLLDCFACHHPLQPGSWRQAGRRGATTGSPLAPPPTALAARIAGVRPDQSPRERVQLASDLLTASIAGPGTSWEGATSAYLAAQAIAADLTGDRQPGTDHNQVQVRAALAELGRYLSAECFAADDARSPGAGLYDSPTQFSPTEHKTRVRSVVAALGRLAESLEIAGDAP